MAARADAMRRADGVVAVGAVVAAGYGVALALTGAGADELPLVVAGGAAAAAGLFIILAAGWVDGTLLLALCLPLPALYSSESLRISPALVLTGLVVPAWLLRRTAEGRAILLGALPRRAMALLAAALVVTGVFAQARLPALRELVTFALLFGVLAMAADEVMDRPAKARSIALAIGGAAAACGVFAALEAMGVLPGRFPHSGSLLYRAALGFEWPNELGMYFALSLPFAVYARTVAEGHAARTLAAAGIGTCLVGLAVTFSRGSWLSAAAGTATLVLLADRRLLMRVWLGGLVAVVALDLVTGGALRGRIAMTMVDDIVAQRLALQYTGLLMFRANPVVGVGPGGFGANLEQYGPQVSWLWDYIGSAHNLYVHMAAETGIIGLATLVGFLAAVFAVLVRSARRARDGAGPDEAALRRACAWSFGTLLVVGMFEWPFAHGIGQLIMLVAGMGCGLAAAGSGGPAGADDTGAPAELAAHAWPAGPLAAQLNAQPGRAARA
ncbi:MAG TPA: O-antigen ligase family protein [Longimicrobiales bacterium]